MPLSQEEIVILKAELDTDPTSIGWDNMNNEDVVTKINKRNTIVNPTPQGTIKQAISVTTFINIIPEAEWLNLYNHTGAGEYGKLIYDRLLSLEAAGASIITTEALITRLMNYSLAQDLITQETFDSLSTSDDILDPSWESEVIEDSRAMVIGITSTVVEGNDVKAARTV